MRKGVFLTLIISLLTSLLILTGCQEEATLDAVAECDIAKAIKEKEALHLQTPISYEKALQILNGSSPSGNRLRFDGSGIYDWFLPLEETYYLISVPTFDPPIVEVAQVWYRAGTAVPQYFIICQSPAENPRKLFGSPCEPTFTLYLEDGSLAKFTLITTLECGSPLAGWYPEWTQYIWHVEWVSNDIQYTLRAVNLDSFDLGIVHSSRRIGRGFNSSDTLQIVEDLSGQRIGRIPIIRFF